ncbi:MAG TPA: trypsin-like peptidase domain-containing protein [Ignavibacteria bacterium]|nr:trypsin-like peptidase domain-containing protein [Ignavibacteria bacterium]
MYKLIFSFFFSYILFTSNISFSQFDSKNGDILNAEQVMEKNKEALVSIWYNTETFFSYYSRNVKDTTILNGSGFIVSPDGLIGTNNHVVEFLDSILVKLSDGTFYDAELVAIDDKNDIAILRLKNTGGRVFPVVNLGDSDSLKVGQNVFAIGSPLGFEYTISQGIIAAIRYDEKVNFSDPLTWAYIEKKFDKVIQITAAISPGNSGGALFNEKGEVIGVTTYSYGFYGNLNFAIAINSFKNTLNNALSFEFADSEEAKLKKEENLYNINYRLFSRFKTNVISNWYYSKQADTMKAPIDTFVVKQDSINKINFSKTEFYFDKLVDIRPDSFDVYRDMLNLYIETEMYSKGEDMYIKIKEKFDNDSLLNTLSSMLANAYTSSKNYDKALGFYQKLLKEDSTSIYNRFQIGVTYEKMKRYKDAINIFNDVIKRDSTYIQAYSQIGEIYFLHFNDYKMAKKYLENAYIRELKQGYSSYDAKLLYYRGIIAIEEGNEMDALLAFIELKNTYTYTEEDTEKKLLLYNALKKLLD